MLLKELEKIKNEFESNLRRVESLLDFDHVILDKTLEVIEQLQTSLSGVKGFAVFHLKSLNNTINQLSSIKSHQSTKINYETISNQCVVLLISYLSSALQQLLEVYINCYPAKISQRKQENIKINLSSILNTEGTLKEKLGEIILNSDSQVSFQDMRSIRDTFKEYAQIDIDWDNTVNNIIFAQAARHCIVHNSGIADTKFRNQIKIAKQRTIKTEFNSEEVVFKKEEVKELKKEILNFFNKYFDKMVEKPVDE